MKIATYIICASLAGIAIAWDIYLALTGEPTISQLVWASNSKVIPFAAGVLCGHLFWRR